MNNNIKKAEQKIDCFNKNNPNITYTCYVPNTTTASTVRVGTTTTTAPGTNASVTNVGTPTNAILNFSIPRGEPGTPGSQVNAAYANLYSTSNTALNLTAATPSNVPLATVGISNNVTTSTANKLTITNTGDYKIDYLFSGAPGVAATLTLNVKNNGNTVAGSSISESATANETVNLQGTVLATLNANDVINLDISSQVEATVTPSDGTNAYLVITKLN